MEGDYKIVDYDKWCSKCRYYLKEDTSEPCNECLENPAVVDSRKPLMFKKSKVKNRRRDRFG